MVNNKVLTICLKYIAIAVFSFSTLQAISQPVVGLDNWFNREKDAATGQSFHYLWSDTGPGGYSEWGEIFKSKGAKLTTTAKPDETIMDRTDIYIIVDPDTTSEVSSPNYIEQEDIKVICKWVERGGVLAVFANDGPNCEFTHLNTLMLRFGMKFNHVTLHRVNGNDFEAGASYNLPDHPLFKGVTKIFVKDISDISLSGNSKSILTENGKTLIAENRYGDGFVFAIGDPWIYNEYIGHERLPAGFDNHRAAENLTDLLLEHSRKNK